MKLSLAWIFDHIDADWRTIDISSFVDQFNKTAAEIEGVQKISFKLDQFGLGQVEKQTADTCTVQIKEWKKTVELPSRDDYATAGASFLVKKAGDKFAWTTLVDFLCPKDGLFPAVHVQEDMRAGGWKKQIATEDYLLEVDNKTITHRPDMWGHRGFAREVAAMLDKKFLPLKNFVVEKEIKTFDSQAPATKDNPVAITLKDQEVGKRFAGLYLETKARPSSLSMALRLAVTGNRPIDFFVDVTNYVMLDIGQPMHAFEADQLKNIEARLAKKGEKLILLDDQEIELTQQDYVITDGKKPISLAGVMGGKESGVSSGFAALFLESANFDATTVRRTAARFKTRTEASARFEKTLDPSQNTDAILRFLKLCDDEGLSYKAAQSVHSVGKKVEPIQIKLSHDFLCKRLGVQLEPDFVVATLSKIGFTVAKSGDEYDVTVPTFRCTKDVTIPEDLVEEVGRFFGYENIEYTLPEKKLEPSDLISVMRTRQVRSLLAYALHMKEVYNYSLYDESFLHTIGFESKDLVSIKNPLSENWLHLVSSLIPHLLKNIADNVADNDALRFFEWGRRWGLVGKEVQEKKSLAGVLFHRKKEIDFYDAKAVLVRLFTMLELDVVWKPVEKKNLPQWAAPYQTAALYHGKTCIGFAGKVHPLMLEKVSEGDAFLFDLDGDFLLAYETPEKKYQPASKYPSVHRDVSVFVSLAVTVDQISEAIASSDKRVRDVMLVDLFQKDDWKDQKSLTVRFVIQDDTKTLTSEEADAVYAQITKKLEKLGAAIR